MTTKLMQSLNFTEDDLTYNRKGTLSPRQNAHLTRKRRAFKLILLILGLLLAGVGGGVFGVPGVASLPEDASAATGMLVGAGVFVLIGVPFIYLGVKPMRPVKVEVAKGKARLARVQRSSRSKNSTSTYIASEIHVAGKIFSVPDEAFPELEDGAVYAVYYWDGLNNIFSLERI